MATPLGEKYYKFSDPNNPNRWYYEKFLENTSPPPGYINIPVEEYVSGIQAVKTTPGAAGTYGTDLWLQQAMPKTDTGQFLTPEGMVMDQAKLDWEAQQKAGVLSGTVKRIEFSPGNYGYIPAGSPADLNIQNPTDALAAQQARAVVASTFDSTKHMIDASGAIYDKITGALIYKPEGYDATIKTMAQAYPDKYAPSGSIPVDTVTDNIRPISLPSTPQGTTGQGTIAVAEQTAQGLKDWIAKMTPPETAKSMEADTLTAQISKLIGETAGQSAMLREEEQKAGVLDLEKRYNDIQNQIMTRTAAYNALYQEQEGKPITMSSIIGKHAQIKKSAEAEIGFLTAQGQAALNNLTYARQIAQGAVDTKYEPILEELKIKQAQLDLLQPYLDKEEKIIAAAQTAYLNQQLKAVEEQKTAQKEAVSFALSNNVTKPFYKVGDMIFQTLDGMWISNMEEARKMGVLSDLSNVQDMSAPRVVKTETIGSATTGYKLVSYDQYGNVVKSEVLSGATPSGGGETEIIPGLFTKSELAEFRTGGLDTETATDIYELIQQGYDLESIRQGLRQIGKDPKLLDVFDRVKPIYEILGQEKPESSPPPPVNWEKLDTQNQSWWDKLWGWLK